MTGHEHTYTVAELEARVTALMVQRDRMQERVEELEVQVNRLRMFERSAANDYQKIADFMHSLPSAARRAYFRPGSNMVDGLLAYIAALEEK